MRSAAWIGPCRRDNCLHCLALFVRRRSIFLVVLGRFMDRFLYPLCSAFWFAQVALCPSFCALMFGLLAMTRPVLVLVLDFIVCTLAISFNFAGNAPCSPRWIVLRDTVVVLGATRQLAGPSSAIGIAFSPVYFLLRRSSAATLAASTIFNLRAPYIVR